MPKTKARPANVTQARPQMKGTQLPPPAQTSDKGDSTVMLAFYGGMSLTVLLVGSSLVAIGAQLKGIITTTPVNWLAVVGMVVLTVLTVFLSRGLIWLTFFGAMMLGSKIKGLKAQEKLCRTALSWRMLVPALGSWASNVLVQNLIMRGEFKEVITVGETEYARSTGKKGDEQTLGPLCTAIAISYQVQGDDKQSITWNERAVESLSKVLATMEKPGKDGKLPKNNQWTDGLRMQLAMAHFNAANAYFKGMNYGQAKANYQKAVEYAYKAPESSEKKQILQVAKDQLGRLKHT